MVQRADTTSSRRDARQAPLEHRRRVRVGPAVFAALAAAMLAVPADAQELAFPGGVLWELTLDVSPTQLPAFDDNNLYVALRDGTLRAIDHASGATRWSASASASVAPASSGRVVAGADGATAWGLDAGTGGALWKRPLGGKAARAPAATEQGALFVTDDGDAVLLAWDDGKESWRVRLPGLPSAPLVSSGGQAWAGLSDGTVLALELSDGHTAWARRLPLGVLVLTPLGDRLLAGCADNFLYALKASDGGTSWRWRTGGDIVGSAAGDRRRVYFVSLDATLRALDRAHGTMRWQRPLDSRPIGGPLLAGDVLIVAGIAPELRAFRTKDGGVAASAPVPGRALHGPYLAKARGSTPPRLLLLTAGGHLLAVGQTIEPRIVPLDFLPGKPVAPETLPAIR